MEVLAAISLAGNVAQFLGYGISTVRLASQIMRSVTGTSKHLTELEIISTDITATLEAIQKERQSSSGLERDEVLHELVEQCLDLSREIINLINGLKVKKNARPRIMEGTYKVGLTVYKKKELEHLSGRLFDLRTQVTSHLIVLIEQQQRDIHETLRRFSDSNEKYQDLFDKHLHVVMGYLDKISNKLDPHEVADGKTADFTTVQSSNGFLESVGIDDGDEEAEDAQEALSSYIDIVDHLYRVELGAHAESKRQSILESLRFSQLHERELLIPKAHQQTFEWIFDSTEEFSFNDWLRSRNGIFWVAGKAGSGKSSLMRFITEHPTTFKLLSQWADGNITVAKHYFWNPGTALQKSQEGLLRTCLLQILSTRPHLIPAICADRWAAPYAARYSPWTRSQLLKALKSLKDTADESSNPHLKLCLFIDGLDEYEGDHVELINILSDLAECSNIKICVSSRPWLDFSDAFDGSPWKIYLQDLTRQDISRYVQDKLEEDERFKRLQSKNNTAASDLINDVTIRSEGVFLWVFLVVRSLLRGLRNQDDLAILRQRLEALPVDLSAFFDRILDSIEDVYRQCTARLFLALSSARRSFPVLSFFFLDLDDPKYPADPPDLAFLKEWPDGDTRSFEALITKKRQLVAQCKDIIHIASDPKAPVLFGERVTFLHRTVVDFMNKDDTCKQLQRHAGPRFDPLKILFDASLGQARSLMHLYRLTYIRDHLSQWILGCFFYAYRIELTSSSPCEPVNLGLDELEQTIAQTFPKWDFSHALGTLLDREDITSFIDLAARCDLAVYVKYRLPRHTAAMLDEISPGWRSPCCIQQLSSFELCPQNSDGSWDWRLGHSTGVIPESQSPINSDKDEICKETVWQLPQTPIQGVGINQHVKERRKSKFLRSFAAVFCWRYASRHDALKGVIDPDLTH